MNAVAPADPNAMPEVVDGMLVEHLPGPDALYDLAGGEPQSLLSEPPAREVVFPNLGLPWAQERATFRKRLHDDYGLTYGLSHQQLNQ